MTIKRIQLATILLALFTFASAPVEGQVRRPTRPAQLQRNAVPASADSETSAALSEIVRQRIDTAMNAELEKLKQDPNSEVAGMVVGIIVNNRIMHLNAYGTQSVRDASPMSVETPLCWASISKVMTAVAAWQQILDPKIDLALESKAADLVPTWTADGAADLEQKRRVTVGQLLIHESGVGHYKSPDSKRKINNTAWRDQYRNPGVRTLQSRWNAAKCVAYYHDKEIDWPQGRFEYTTFGSCLLGAIVDATAKQHQLDYGAWVREKIAAPARMETLSIDRNYQHSLPGGGWKSTITDLARFAHGLMNDRFVPLGKLTQTINSGTSWQDRHGRGICARVIQDKLYVGHTGLHSDVRTSMMILATRQSYRTKDAQGQRVREYVRVAPEKFGVVVMVNDGIRTINLNGVIAAAYDATH